MLCDNRFVLYFKDLILLNIIEPLKTQRKNSASLAKEIISKTSDTLEPYIQQVKSF